MLQSFKITLAVACRQYLVHRIDAGCLVRFIQRVLVRMVIALH
jgi:hypothetical protein